MTQDDNEIFPNTPQAGGGEGGEGEDGGDGIILEFASFREFIDRYSDKISDEGLFILSEEPRPVGESVAFEVRLSDDFRLVQGRGSVVWRVPPGTQGQEAGMAIRFEEIDEPSRRLITRLVNNHRGEGGSVFDLSTPVAIGLESAEETGSAEELFVTDPRQGAPVPSGDTADELFGESPFQVPAGPETIALPRDLVPSAETAGLDSLLRREPSASEPLHPIGPLDPPPPSSPPAAPPVDFVEETVPEIDEDFTPFAEGEPAVLPEIVPPSPSSPEPSSPEPSSPEPDASPTPGPDVTAASVLDPSLFQDTLLDAVPDAFPENASDSIPSVGPAVEATLPLSGDAREIPLAPPEAILEPPIEPEMREPRILELGLTTPTDEPNASLAPPDITSEISQITQEVTGGPLSDVEMPEPEEMDEDYSEPYAASSATSSAGPGRWLWVGLCLVAIVLGGIAAVRYQERLRELMPWIPGGDQSVSTAADRPSLDELRARLLGEQEAAAAPDAAPVGSGETTDAAGAAGSSPSDETVRAEPTSPEPTSPEPTSPEPTSPEATPVVEEDGDVDSAGQVAAGPRSDPPVSEAGSPTAGPAQSAGRVESIQWTDQDGSTIVTIETAGLLSRDSFEHVRVSGGSPREVIKVFGVTEPFPSRVYEVSSGQVVRLRTGSHPGDEVHIVADLVDGSVRMSGIDVAEKVLRVTFSR